MVPSHFYPGDLVTHTGDRVISSPSGRLPDYPGFGMYGVDESLFISQYLQ